MHKTYLGDGVYVEVDTERDMLRLTTENGVEVSNEIWLDIQPINNLIQYLRDRGVLSYIKKEE